jgi:hypothetical protein
MQQERGSPFPRKAGNSQGNRTSAGSWTPAFAVTDSRLAAPRPFPGQPSGRWPRTP